MEGPALGATELARSDFPTQEVESLGNLLSPGPPFPPVQNSLSQGAGVRSQTNRNTGCHHCY